MFMTPKESERFFRQINEAFESVEARVKVLEAKLEEMTSAKAKKPADVKSESGNNTKTKEKA